MPFLNATPWRSAQFLENVPCPDHVKIPTSDLTTWELYPEHRWIFNKLSVALSQGLDAAPHGIIPKRFPVFSKPIYNLRGLGTGSRVIPDLETYRSTMEPGHFWSTLLTGEHVSSDVALVQGQPCWWRHATGIPLEYGAFDYWKIHAKDMPELEDWCGAWAETHLSNYTGMANFETIGGRIIEAHLRFTDSHPDLYGFGFLEAVVQLYGKGYWDFDDSLRKDGFSVVLFGAHGKRYRHPEPELLEAARALPGISSVAVAFHEDPDTAAYAPMPPGGFRLAIINSTTLEAGMAARDFLSQATWT